MWLISSGWFDVGCFSVFKRQIETYVKAYINHITKVNIFLTVKAAYLESMMVQNAKAGFRRAILFIVCGNHCLWGLGWGASCAPLYVFLGCGRPNFRPSCTPGLRGPYAYSPQDIEDRIYFQLVATTLTPSWGWSRKGVLGIMQLGN